MRFVLMPIILLVTCLSLASAEELKNPTMGFKVHQISDVENAIKYALMYRKWRLDEHDQEKREIFATLYIRTHMAKIKLSYDERSITITYLDSHKLGYKERKGQEYIHKNYNGWVVNLIGDLRNILGS